MMTCSKLSLLPFFLVCWPTRRASTAAFLPSSRRSTFLVSTPTPTTRYQQARAPLTQVPATRTSSTIHNTRRSLCCCAAKPKRGSIVDSYQTVSVNCSTCGVRLFRYKKKNGTKSNLIKCYVERIVDDCEGVLSSPPAGADAATAAAAAGVIPTEYACPSCQTRFARAATIKGLPALKLVGGKTRMTKK